METKDKKTGDIKSDLELNKQLEGNDKAPGEEDGKGEKVTVEALKGKAVDEDPTTKAGKPLPIKK